MGARKAGMLITALVVGAIAVSPQAAVAAPALDLKIAKHKDGPYVEAPGPSPLTVNVPKPKNLWAKAYVVPDTSVDVLLFAEAGNQAEDYKFKWHRGRHEISHDVKTSGYRFNLEHDHPQRFRVRVSPRVPDPGPACLGPYIHPDGSASSYQAFFAINDPSACV